MVNARNAVLIHSFRGCFFLEEVKAINAHGIGHVSGKNGVDFFFGEVPFGVIVDCIGKSIHCHQVFNRCVPNVQTLLTRMQVLALLILLYRFLASAKHLLRNVPQLPVSTDM